LDYKKGVFEQEYGVKVVATLEPAAVTVNSLEGRGQEAEGRW
jgi:hypothetical protein